MQVKTLDLPEVKLVIPRRFEDARGYFCEVYNKRMFDDVLASIDFVQDNESFSRAPYTVRGLHYQAPPHAQDKLVRVVRGRVFDVAVDARKSSPAYGRWAGAELSAENGAQLFVPAGFLHGFMTLERDTLVAYKTSAFYDAASDGAVYWASDALAIDWPAPLENAVVSDKDAGAPRFEDFDSPF